MAEGFSVRYDDWGVRSQQWAGLRSVSTSVCGVPVHYVRAEPGSAAAHEASVHLLVPPMTGSASTPSHSVTTGVDSSISSCCWRMITFSRPV